MVTACPFETSG